MNLHLHFWGNLNQISNTHTFFFIKIHKLLNEKSTGTKASKLQDIWKQLPLKGLTIDLMIKKQKRCLWRSGRCRAGRTRLLLRLSQLSWSQVLRGKQTAQSAYMLCAPPGPSASPHAHGAFCLICCFDVCIKIISSLGVCVMGALKAMQKKYLGGKVPWMALTFPNSNRNIFSIHPFLYICTHKFCGAMRNLKEFGFWKVSFFAFKFIIYNVPFVPYIWYKTFWMI